MGSSPLTRGIQSGWSTNASVSRFTPAHAGNTSGQKSALCSMKVHPRSRGEYQLYNVSLDMPTRFTPAHAGNTCYFIYEFYIDEVHPRSRGEYLQCHDQEGSSVGSPPLTRGIHPLPLPGRLDPGFTPAHAGNTAILGVHCSGV